MRNITLLYPAGSSNGLKRKVTWKLTLYGGQHRVLRGCCVLACWQGHSLLASREGQGQIARLRDPCKVTPQSHGWLKRICPLQASQVGRPCPLGPRYLGRCYPLPFRYKVSSCCRNVFAKLCCLLCRDSGSLLHHLCLSRNVFGQGLLLLRQRWWRRLPESLHSKQPKLA